VTARLRFALLGHPVRHSVSPAMHAAAFSALGLPHSYTAIDTPNEGSVRRLVAEIRRGSFQGANVTVPYKHAVLEMVDEIADSAAEVGAANVLVRRDDGKLVAHNTDSAAVAAEIADLARGRTRPLLRAVVLGAGGAAASAVAACRKLDFKVVGVTSRSWNDTETMFEAPRAERMRSLGALTAPWPVRSANVPPSGKASQVLRMQWIELARDADLLIQATSAGMTGLGGGEDVAALVPWGLLAPETLVVDVVYNPLETPLLRLARERNLRSANGLGMLVRQGAAALTLWTGLEAPVDVMKDAALRALAATAQPPV
jgi:shikimate dehydrogenase